ncbi:hypothetical protein [Actinoplanes sp. N902-109]|uniref:hypothetical protein n=1 Tax=Actinoplanes sp. (strain N902-109) TaxID=649831 RepID=UPI0003294190|nr:hypothetical protein [Actinoplanes sp. N902-109]AGL13880.1 hypothetical protein L083_0370 [Actinoplanes sp. N902-109]
MTKTLYWIADTTGAKAIVEGADERDTWTKVRGWAETTEPVAGELVWMQHEEHGGRAQFDARVVPDWEHLGWNVSSPPEPVDLTKDPTLVDQPPAEAEPVAAKPVKRAASGADKE